MTELTVCSIYPRLEAVTLSLVYKNTDILTSLLLTGPWREQCLLQSAQSLQGT